MLMVIGLGTVSAFGQQSDSGVDETEWLRQIQEFKTVNAALLAEGADLLDYRKTANPFSPDVRIIDSMLSSMDLVQTYVMITSALLSVTRLITGAEQKQLAQSYVNVLLEGYSTQIGLELQRIDLLLSNTRSQAIITAGRKLKLEIQKSKDLIETRTARAN